MLTAWEAILNTVQRSFRLQGPGGLGAKPRPELIGPVLSSLHSELLGAVRMGFLYSSQARGRVPGVLKAAAEVRYVGLEGDGEDTTVLHFVVPSFGSVASELFEQRSLWDDGPRPEDTAFELFGNALHDVATRRLESNSFDPGLLKKIGKYRRLLKRGVNRIDMPDTTPAKRGEIDAHVVRTATELYEVTPSPQRLRVAGRLDVMGASQGVLKLEVRPGEIVTALWHGPEPVEQFRDLFNRDVVLEGVGIFRPSGSLLRIDADVIASASPTDDFFRRLPVVKVRPNYHKLARIKPGDRSAWLQLRGTLPADESDEEFERALAALR
jgi:hypothetical protein